MIPERGSLFYVLTNQLILTKIEFFFLTIWIILTLERAFSILYTLDIMPLNAFSL